jgi:uncharacterized protein (TIGR04255 family)
MTTRVDYERPPVIEVVSGVLFEELKEFRVPHIGIFWSSLRDEFPQIEDRPPLQPIIEGAGPGKVELQLVDTPPVPRVWFISEDGRCLIQMQRDRFLYNWKRADDADEYPRYEMISAEFEKYLTKFQEFIKTEKLGALSFLQYELQYVNHITSDNGLKLVGEGGLLIDHMIAEGSRFLPRPDGFNWSSAYELPDKQGRLYISAQSALRAKGDRIVRLDLTARGMPDNRSEAARKPWFALAHNWIVNAFADVTAPVLQRDVWRRTK